MEQLLALCATGIFTVAAVFPAFAETPRLPQVEGFPVTHWDNLMPPGWDPLSESKIDQLAAVQDGDPAADRAMKDMREIFDNAPANLAMNGKGVTLAGYIVPLERDADGALLELLLVPYFGACIHQPPPPANQIVHVTLREAAPGYRAMMPVWLSGTLSIDRSETQMGVTTYRMSGERIEPYKG